MTNVVGGTEENKKIKIIYRELIALWRELPKGEEGYIWVEEVWEQYQSLIDDLIKMTNTQDYCNYRVKVDSNHLNIDYYRSQLARLITRLHQEYYSDETDPLNPITSAASTIFNNQNSQQQSQQQYMTVTLFEIRDRIDQRLSQSIDEKEKTFLEKLKGHLSTMTTISQLIKSIFDIAHQSGLDMPTAKHIIGTLLA